MRSPTTLCLPSNTLPLIAPPLSPPIMVLPRSVSKVKSPLVRISTLVRMRYVPLLPLSLFQYNKEDAHQKTLQFAGARGISSDDYFGRTQPSSHSLAMPSISLPPLPGMWLSPSFYEYRKSLFQCLLRLLLVGYWSEENDRSGDQQCQGIFEKVNNVNSRFYLFCGGQTLDNIQYTRTL